MGVCSPHSLLRTRGEVSQSPAVNQSISPRYCKGEGRPSPDRGSPASESLVSLAVLLVGVYETRGRLR